MALFDFLTLTPKSSIGGIEIAASLEEIHTDTLQATEHPVERGAAITDHAFKRPAEVTLRCGWTNSSLDALLGAITSLFSGDMSASDYITGVYSQLLALQESRVPFEIITAKRKYSNMLIVSLNVTTDQKTGNALMLTATCKEILIVQTQATTLPDASQQANPANTQERADKGTIYPTADNPQTDPFMATQT